MAESNQLVNRIHACIDEFLRERTSIFASISDELSPFTDFSRQFLSGGKRFRAQFCYWGWKSALSGSVIDAHLKATIGVASALEIFHAAALVHDDIIDSSDTRRGSPSAHKRFESLHSAEKWAGSPSAYGESSALLLGDLLLGFSDELLDESLELVADRDHARSARQRFNAMRTEVTAGQYLDILEENAWNTRSESELLDRAQDVIVYKSAKYSVEAPLLIGASIAGASVGQIET